MALQSKGMLIDGVFASEAIDSSGEVASIKGMNVDSLPVDGMAVYEHLKPDTKEDGDSQFAVAPKHKDGRTVTLNGQELVGRIVYVKKIFSEKDCDDDRQRFFWDQVKFPYLYGIVRLADGAGHEGAKALAAHVRDQHAHGEPLTVRYSIEGNTLNKDGNVLDRTVARRVAITLKPCNRSCHAGLIFDPNAPEGYEKRPTRIDPPMPLVKAEGALEPEDPTFVDILSKATTGGGYDAAPSALTGGAALQREDEGLHRKVARLIRSADPETFKKTEFRTLLRHELPEVADEFLDRFADVADSYHARMRGGRLTKGEGHGVELLINKAEAATIEILAAAAELRKAREESPDRPTWFAGLPVTRGCAETADGKWDLLHEDDGGYVAVPEGTKEGGFATELKRFPRELEGSHYRVLRRPVVAIADL